MPYTEPVDFVAGEPFLEAQANKIQANLRAVKDPPNAHIDFGGLSNHTTTSTSFVDVDGTNLSLTIITTGSDVEVHFHGTIKYPATTLYFVAFDITVGGVRQGGVSGIVSENSVSYRRAISFKRRITGLAAGSHTVKLQWKVTSGSYTATLYAGGDDGQFGIKEVN